MPPQDVTNTGSFGAATGGTQALKNAMGRRGMDAGILDQVSASAPTGPSPVAPDVQGGNVGIQAVGQAAPQPTQAQTRSGEMEIALKSLSGVVKTESKIAEALVGLNR